MERKYLIDTNVVIDYLNNKLPNNAANLLEEEKLQISVITRIELLAWPNASGRQISILEDFIGSGIVWDLDEPVILKGIEIRKAVKTKLPDAIIAATALTQNLILVTRNTDDFKNIPALELINPWTL